MKQNRSRHHRADSCFFPVFSFTYHRSFESFATEIIPQKPRLCHSEKDGDEFAEKIFKIVLKEI